MSDKDGKWRAYNLNNGPHDCQKNGKDKQDTSKQQQQPTKQDFTLEAVLKKLEKIGIKVNLEELMKA